ncbi:MAG TPA: GNAT family N-acetyltransferase [Solirubrobacteraceae bacterium]|nr:GNAT family N-acetyltransferase [Solirubrobacteraceae bacterium]
MPSPPTATLRHADPARDASACAAIYAPYVAGSATSFEEVAPNADGFSGLIATTSRRYPWIVLEQADQVIGYAYASSHRVRAAYRWTVEVSIYVGAAHQRAGGGRRLYEALVELLRRQRLRVALAGITMPNDASVGLHRALGFELVGVYRDVGWKAGAWRDVAWWQLRLADGDDDESPPEPLGPQPLP